MIMKEIIEDYKAEGYTLAEWVKYGVIVPMVLIGLCLLASVF